MAKEKHVSVKTVPSFAPEDDVRDAPEETTRTAKKSCARASVGFFEAPKDDNLEIKVYKRIGSLVGWFVFILVLGALVGTASTHFHMLVHFFEHSYPPKDMGVGLFILLRIIGVFVTATGACIIGSEYMPEVGGGGIIPVKLCLCIGAPVPFKVGFWRFVVSSIYLGFGNPLGAETPTLHYSTAIGCSLYALGRKVVGPEMFPGKGRTSMVVIGCVAGVAAAFNSTLGGLVYQFEHFPGGAGFMVKRLLALYATLACCASCLATRMFSRLYGYNSGVNISLQEKLQQSIPVTEDITAYCGVAILASFVFGGVAHCFLLCTRETRFYLTKYVHGRYHGIFSAFATSLLASLCYLSSGLTGVWGVGWESLAQLLLQEDISIGNRILFFVSKFIVCSFAVAAGGNGGIYGPALVIGGAAGSILSIIFSSDTESFGYIIFPALGMCGVFSAMHRLPLTAIIISYEFVDLGDSSYDVIFIMLLVSFMSEHVAAELSEADIFGVLFEQDGIDLVFLAGGSSRNTYGVAPGMETLIEENNQETQGGTITDPRQSSVAALMSGSARRQLGRGTSGSVYGNRNLFASIYRRTSQPDQSSKDTEDALVNLGALHALPSMANEPESFEEEQQKNTTTARKSQRQFAMEHVKSSDDYAEFTGVIVPMTPDG